MSFWQEDWLGFGPLMNFLSSDQWESVEDKQVSVSQAFAEDGLLNFQLVEDEIRNIIHPKVAGMKENSEFALSTNKQGSVKQITHLPIG